MTKKGTSIKQVSFPWKKIWEEFGSWCESQEVYPREWFEQQPALQSIIKKHRPAQYKRTDWKKVWNAFTAAWNSGYFLEWYEQKIIIQKYVLKYSTKQ
jgi:hypothetical protein